MSLSVEQLWRYPVKTLAGEWLTEAELTANGIPGDRIVHVRGPEGVRTSRRQHHRLALADDYVTKPFSLAEIVARVQSVLRRTRGDTEGSHGGRWGHTAVVGTPSGEDGLSFLVAGRDDLIMLKRATGRDQDLIDVEALRLAEGRDQ